jgi:hypothetical protein
MQHLLWLLPVVSGLAAIKWPALQVIALLTMLVCGVVYLLGRAGRPAPPAPSLGTEQKRDPYSVQRDIPPSS